MRDSSESENSRQPTGLAVTKVLAQWCDSLDTFPTRDVDIAVVEWHRQMFRAFCDHKSLFAIDYDEAKVQEICSTIEDCGEIMSDMVDVGSVAGREVDANHAGSLCRRLHSRVIHPHMATYLPGNKLANIQAWYLGVMRDEAAGAALRRAVLDDTARKVQDLL